MFSGVPENMPKWALVYALISSAAKALPPSRPSPGGAQIGDLVHAEVADLGKGAVVADEVVVLVVPEQGIGAHVVPRAAAAQNAPAVPVVSRVVEPDALGRR